MFTKQMDTVADVLIKKEISKREDKDFLVYGLSIGIELIFNMITTIALGFIGGMVLESLVFLVSFSFLRIYAGGYHCKKAITCYFLSSGVVAFVLLMVKFTTAEQKIMTGLIMLVFSVLIILKFAPMETPDKLFDEEERNYYRKKVMLHLKLECSLIYILFLMELSRFAFIICLGIAISSGFVFLQKLKVI
jgi:accessory gene regulator B